MLRYLTRTLALIVALFAFVALFAIFIFPSPRVLAGGCPFVGAPPPSPVPWPMFHRDEQHTGVVTETVGNFIPSRGPTLRWRYKVVDISPGDINFYRWASSFPLGDLDGDGTLEVVVTTPNAAVPIANRIIALKDTPHEASPVRDLWVYTDTISDPGGFDMYSTALADADGDGLPDVIATSSDGHLFVLRGCDGRPIWDPPYAMNHTVESGPMIADLNGDGKKEIIVTTAAARGAVCNADQNGPNCGALYVFALTDTIGITNHLIYSQTFPYKMDSAVPAIADLDPSGATSRKAMIIGTWGGVLLTAWRNAGGQVITHTLDLRQLDPTVVYTHPPVIRSAPLVWDFGEGQTVVFGWMPDHEAGGEARISAVKLRANMLDDTLVFTPTWTINRQAWKSFPTLLPVTNPPLVVDGWGAGVPSDPPTGQGNPTDCGTLASPLTGGVLAMNVTGPDVQRVVWEKDFDHKEGYRNFAAVADFNGDGRFEVILANQCFGKLHAFDGVTGEEQWNFQLGPYLLASPTVGDLDGDGKLEIVESSLDGYVWALSGGSKTFLPFLLRNH